MIFDVSSTAETTIAIVIVLLSHLLLSLSLSSHQSVYVGVAILPTNIASVCLLMYLCDIIPLLISTDVHAASTAFSATVLIPSRCFVHHLSGRACTRCACTALECFCPCYALAEQCLLFCLKFWMLPVIPQWCIAVDWQFQCF